MKMQVPMAENNVRGKKGFTSLLYSRFRAETRTNLLQANRRQYCTRSVRYEAEVISTRLDLFVD